MTAVFLPVPYLFSQVFSDAGVVGNGYQAGIYQAGTTFPISTFPDSTLTNPNPNPVVFGSNGRLVNSSGGTFETWVNSGTVAKIVLMDNTGAVIHGGTFDNIAGINDITLTPATIGAALYPVTTAEGATVINVGYPYGDIRRYGGNGDNGVTDNTQPLNNAIASGFPVSIPASVNGGYKMSGNVLVTVANCTITLGNGAKVYWANSPPATTTNFLGSPALAALLVQADNFTLTSTGLASWVGFSVNAYTPLEFGVLRVGPSASNRGNGFTVTNMEFYNWGYAAITTQFMQNVVTENCQIHNCGYAGLFCVSDQIVRVRNCWIHDITPGTSGNCYGLQLTHDSTNYSIDQNAVSNPRQTVNPFCIDCIVEGCTIYNIPLWNAAGAHGAYETTFRNNKVYNAYIGLQISSSSGDASNYAGENNRIEGNEIYANQINGNPQTVTTVGGHAGPQGIIVNGGSKVGHSNVWVTNNSLVGMGEPSATGIIALQASVNVYNFVCTGNVFRACQGRAIYTSTGTFGTIANNIFDSVGASATGSNCIYIDSNTGELNIHGNVHSPITGTTTAYLNGLNAPGSGFIRMIIGQNDFDACGTPYVNLAQSNYKGISDLVPFVSDITTGSHPVNLAALAQSPVINYQYGGAGVATITDFTGGRQGQLLMVSNATSSNLTINNMGGHIRLPSGTQTLAQFGAASFVCVGGVWYSLAVPGTNT